jgi:hypothetical protein
MGKRYRHPELGAFHKLDLSGGSIGGIHVPDKVLDELINFLNEADGIQERDNLAPSRPQKTRSRKVHASIGDQPERGFDQPSTGTLPLPSARVSPLGRRTLGRDVEDRLSEIFSKTRWCSPRGTARRSRPSSNPGFCEGWLFEPFPALFPLWQVAIRKV